MVCTGKQSGLSAPAITTLVVDPADTEKNAIVVTPSCGEVVLTAEASENPGEYRINATSQSIGAVVSYPSVQVLDLQNNQITSFKASGTFLKELDLTNNQLMRLDNISIPSGVYRITLDFNTLEGFAASNFPSTITEFYFRKASITSLRTFGFPSSVTKLILDGNTQLTTLYGLTVPTSLTDLVCQNCGLKKIGGVAFPRSLKNLLISGTNLDTFDFRDSDYEILQGATIQATSTFTTCTDPKATTTKLSSSLVGCKYSDTDFAAKYPSIAETMAPTTTSPSPSVTSSSSANGSSSPTTTVTPSATTETTSGGSNSSQTIIVGVLVLVAVIVGVTIGFIFQRRRKARRSEDEGDDTKGKRSRTKTKTKTHDQTDGALGVPAPPNSNGFLDNDVRNDPDLIPYRLPQEDLVIVAKIAQGGFGVVYRAKLFSQEVVIKQVAPNKTDSADVLRRFMDEIRLYSKLDHGKIVRFIGLSWTNLLDLSLVMEYMPNGDLHTMLRASQKDAEGRQQFSWFNAHSQPRCKALLALDIAEALVYLHSFSAPIIHRDLKAKNVLMSSEYVAKLGDFGISRETVENTMTGSVGTTAWIAPEVLQGERYSEKADIYSFGILMCEMDSCDHPYSSNRSSDDSFTDAKIAYLVSTASLKPTLEDDCPRAIQKLIMECLEFDATRRPTAVELHYNLRKVREASLEWGFI